MRTRLPVLLAVTGIVALGAPGAEASTTWTARMGSYGVATIRVGSPDRLSISARNFRSGVAYAVTLRRGSCGAPGAVVLSTRLTSASTGTIVRTLTLTGAQTGAAKLPLSLRIGTRCGAFAAPLAAWFGSGTHHVGSSIQPGTYWAAGSSLCYWERLSGFGGTVEETIANSFGPGPRVVTIKPTDAGFSSSDCGTWRLQSPPVPAPPLVPGKPGDGTWRIGIDIAAGTYRSLGGARCFWERTRGFGGELGEVIANDFGTEHPVVTIMPSDAGFTVKGCGTWTKDGSVI